MLRKCSEKMTDEPNDEIREAVARAIYESQKDAAAHLKVVRDQADAAIAAHKRALADAGYIIVKIGTWRAMADTAGLVIVPREASEDMLIWGEHAYQKTDCGLTDGDSPMAAAWCDMVAKAQEEMGG